MEVRCCVCKKRMGSKPPFDDDSITTTYCPTCEAVAKSRIKVQKEAIKAMKKGEAHGESAGI